MSEVPPMLTDAVLHDRRTAFQAIIGDNYASVVDKIKVDLRAATLDGGTLRDAHARLTADGAKSTQWRNLDEMAYAAALLDCLEAGEMPTEEKLQAAEAAAPVKGKKERKSGKPRKAKAPTIAWAQKIGRSGTRLALPGVKTFEEIGAWLLKCHFAERPVAEERNSGPCIISYSGGTDFSDTSLWKFGEYAVFGWRVDKRKVPSGTLAREVEKKIREEEKLRGGKSVGKAERKAIKSEVRAALLLKALVETQVYSVLMAPSEGWALVDGPLQVIEEFRSRVGLTGWPITKSVPSVVRARLAACTGERFRTDLRQINHDNAPEEGEEKGDVPGGVYSDFMLWLATPGTARRCLAWELEGKVEWKLSGGPVKIRVPVANTSNDVTLEDADSAAFTASLAEGGRIQGCRIALEEKQQAEATEEGQEPAVLVHTYYLTFEVIQGSKTRSAGLRIHSMGLPTLKGGDSAAALVFERVELHKRLWTMVECLFRAYASDRCQDWQATADAARTWVGLELRRRFVFDAATGQGWLFAPQQLQIEAIEDKNAEKPKGRGKGKRK